MRYVCIFLLFPLFLNAQFFDSISLSSKITFVRQLEKNKQLKDACFLLHHFNQEYQIDSLKIYEAKLLLSLKRVSAADSLLIGLRNSSPLPGIKTSAELLLNHSRLLSGESALVQPSSMADTLSRDLWRIQMLTSFILKKDDEMFNLLFNSTKCYHPILSLIEFDLYVINSERLRKNKKSPLLAGFLSGLLPGIGKIYAGKPHEAFHTFIPVALNAAQAAEGYYNAKFKSPHFYFFGTVAAVFYTSNILGSARAAKRKNSENNRKTVFDIEYEISKLLKYY